MLLRLSCFLVLVFYSVLVFSHAVTFECKFLPKSGCVFKRDADGDKMLDCGYKELSEAPKIDQGCSTPKTMYVDWVLCFPINFKATCHSLEKKILCSSCIHNLCILMRNC